MSSSSQPIPPHRFAEAIKELPLANLHFKAAEIQNSMSHLQSSNEQLRSYAEEGDADCKEAIDENLVVIQRMEERVHLLRSEVEGRGFKWSETADEQTGGEINRDRASTDDQQDVAVTNEVGQGARPNGGRLGDEELARRLAQRMQEDGNESDEGVHL